MFSQHKSLKDQIVLLERMVENESDDIYVDQCEKSPTGRHVFTGVTSDAYAPICNHCGEREQSRG